MVIIRIDIKIPSIIQILERQSTELSYAILYRGTKKNKPSVQETGRLRNKNLIY